MKMLSWMREVVMCQLARRVGLQPGADCRRKRDRGEARSLRLMIETRRAQPIRPLGLRPSSSRATPTESGAVVSSENLAQGPRGASTQSVHFVGGAADHDLPALERIRHDSNVRDLAAEDVAARAGGRRESAVNTAMVLHPWVRGRPPAAPRSRSSGRRRS